MKETHTVRNEVIQWMNLINYMNDRMNIYIQKEVTGMEMLKNIKSEEEYTMFLTVFE